jgi:7-cyano-7-deazaguanine reductase
MTNTTDKIASTHLGKKSIGSNNYDSSLLVAVPRIENRTQYNINHQNLPFLGFDVWHAYEFSVMTNNGIPITRVLKIRYNCNNDYLIESKSLKLYLNSFNMTKIGNSINNSLEICQDLIKTDLSKKLQTEVEVNFLDNNSPRVSIYSKFVNLINLVDEKDLFIDSFKENPKILEVELSNKVQEYFLTFDSLRSNCRVTHQPDFGDAFIYYKSKYHIKENSLIKYLTSFRSEFHFHEECCEMIFKRLFDILDEDDELFVSALYTRRGGIDICPSRWKSNTKIEDVSKLIDLTLFARCGIKL